jgi:hypothetical protein
MRITPRRAGRIRDEMRLWLRSQYGLRAEYSQEEIDNGREDLGFSGVEDALVAYTLFGGDLMPDLPLSAEEIGELLEAAADGVMDVADLLVDD